MFDSTETKAWRSLKFTTRRSDVHWGTRGEHFSLNTVNLNCAQSLSLVEKSKDLKCVNHLPLLSEYALAFIPAKIACKYRGI